MTSRQQRRAAERKARKQTVRQGGSPQPASTPEPRLHSPQPSNDYAELIDAATPAVLAPGEERDRYRAHLHQFLQQHQPAPGVESFIVRRLADLQWRLLRIANLEAGILTLGRRKYAELFADAAPELRSSLIDAHTLATDAPVLKCLHTQESHLRRYYRHDPAELTALQQARTESQHAPLAQSVYLSNDLPCTTQDLLLPDDDGFEFSVCNDLALTGHAPSSDPLAALPDFQTLTDRIAA